MKLSELLSTRATLAQQLAELAQASSAISTEIARIDNELFSRMQTLASAIEGDSAGGGAVEPPSVPASGLSLRAHAMPRTMALFGHGFAMKPARKASKLEPAIEAALREAGAPLSRNDLYALLMFKGVEVPGKDPKANLSAHLSNSDQFIRTSDGLWTLKEEDALQRQTPA
jgi:hypothetical protein